MAEITKVTTPMIPRENLGNRNKPVTDQAFETTDLNKVHKSEQERGRVLNQNQDGRSAQWDNMNRETLAPVLRSTTELLHAFQKIAVLLQMGISTSDIAADEEVRTLLESMYLRPDQLAAALKEQDGAAVLFRGPAFDLLRDILGRFSDAPKVKDAVTQLIKAFEQNINAENSVKTILTTCRGLLDYMFTGDRAQFSQYLEELTSMLLPKTQPEPPPEQRQVNDEGRGNGGSQAQAGQGGDETVDGQKPAADAKQPPATPETAKQPGDSAGAKAPVENTEPGQKGENQGAKQTAGGLGMEQREAAQLLKGNLLPLLGEIVVKYNQNGRIRDMVMVVVHNIVRVDQGTPERLGDAIEKLVSELKLVANLPENFDRQLEHALQSAAEHAKNANNGTLEKLASIISDALSSPNTNAATLRQAETLLLSLLQNQNSAMNVLHFILPLQTEQGKLFAEMYVDPDSDEKVGRGAKEKSRKLFLAFESENLGAFELSFLETAEKVDFSMWCPERLVDNLARLKKTIADIMLVHGYTMNSYHVAQLVSPKSIADVFPRLLDRRMGVDVRI